MRKARSSNGLTAVKLGRDTGKKNHRAAESDRRPFGLNSRWSIALNRSAKFRLLT
jgi:hypothetical protein